MPGAAGAIGQALLVLWLARPRLSWAPPAAEQVRAGPRPRATPIDYQREEFLRAVPAGGFDVALRRRRRGRLSPLVAALTARRPALRAWLHGAGRTTGTRRWPTLGWMARVYLPAAGCAGRAGCRRRSGSASAAISDCRAAGTPSPAGSARTSRSCSAMLADFAPSAPGPCRLNAFPSKGSPVAFVRREEGGLDAQAGAVPDATKVSCSSARVRGRQPAHLGHFGGRQVEVVQALASTCAPHLALRQLSYSRSFEACNNHPDSEHCSSATFRASLVRPWDNAHKRFDTRDHAAAGNCFLTSLI